MPYIRCWTHTPSSPGPSNSLTTLLLLVPRVQQEVLTNQFTGKFLEIVKGVSNKVGKKKYGYMRSPELGHNGRTLIIYQKMLDCCVRKAPFTSSILNLLDSLKLDPDTFRSLSELQLRALVRKQRQKLWDSQKHSESLHQEWLANVARQRAQASGDPDWEKRLC